MVHSDWVHLENLDETWLSVSSSSQGILEELSEEFSFEAKNYQFHPLYKKHVWDGRIKLLRPDYTIYRGLETYIQDFCESRGYDFLKAPYDAMTTIDGRSWENLDETVKAAEKFLDNIKLPFELYEEQRDAFLTFVKSNRRLILSPTSSGKSMIIYLIMRFFLANRSKHYQKKVVITVPRIGLVHQLFGDFKDYAIDEFDVDRYVGKLHGKAEDTEADKAVVITTWQTAQTLGDEYMESIGLVIVDEAHSAKANVLKSIIECCKNTRFRVGFTGTLDDTECHKMVIEGLLGPVYRVTTTKELMNQGKVSKLKIVGIVAKHDNETSKKVRKEKKYSYEREAIFESVPRANFLLKYADALKGNVLLLTHSVKIHVPVLERQYEILKQAGKLSKPLKVATGKVKVSEREALRPFLETNDDITVLASFGVFSTGTNVKNIQHVIFGTSNMDVIEILQSIGRGLRKDGKKNKVILHDIIDDFSNSSYTNYSLKHFLVREEIYNKEGFDYNILHVGL